MSGYKSFAVAGAGVLGSYVIDELLKQKSSGKVERIVVLTRSVEGSDALKAKGVESAVVDYNSISSLHVALSGVDVLISTMSAFALDTQENLGDAAKTAGVQLFIPSEFGGDTLKRTDGLFALKKPQRDRLSEIGLPWALFFTGPFADWIWFQPFLGFDLTNGKAEVGGTGNGPVSWTSRRDIARYVVHVTLALPPSKLHNRVFRVEGERTSVNRVLAEYQERTGKKIDITYVPLADEEARKRPENFKLFFHWLLETDGTNGKEEEMNVDWPEFKPERVVDAILGV